MYTEIAAEQAPRADTSALAELSRNASVISTSSSEAEVDLVPPSRSKPYRAFSPPPRGLGGSSSRSPRPPSYLARELGVPQDGSDEENPIQSRNMSRNRSRSKNPSALSADNFKFGLTLGQGSYSVVQKAVHKETGKEYAIKILDKNYLMRMNKHESALAERHVLVKLGAGHPGVVRLHGAFHDKWSWYFVLDLVPNGELQTLLTRMGSFSVTCTRHYTAEIVDALEYMHSKGVIHRDLKPENMLLDEKFHIKITDFGTGKVLEDPETIGKSTFVGTPQYCSPELLHSNVTGRSSDLWALGCVVFRMIAGRHAFQGLSDFLTMQKIKAHEYEIPEGFDEQARDLVEKLLVPDPKRRLGAGPPGSDNDMQALRSHPFLASVTWYTLWTNPPPPLEAGLVKRDIGDADKKWEDVTAAWDKMFIDDDSDLDEIQWAPDAKVPPHFKRREAERTQHNDEETTQTNSNINVREDEDVDIGPMGEIRRTVRTRVNVPGQKQQWIPLEEIPQTTTNTIEPALPPTSITVISPPDTSQATINHITNLPHQDNVPSLTIPHSLSSQENGTPSPSTQSPRSPSPEANGHELDRTEAVERGRSHAMSPVQGNKPPGASHLASALKLSADEDILYESTVEAKTMKRRASRLFPLAVTSGKQRPRQLVLTNCRLICVKDKRGKDPTIKSELTLPMNEKDPKRAASAKEPKTTISSVERKGEREFVVLTVGSFSHNTYLSPSPHPLPSRPSPTHILQRPSSPSTLMGCWSGLRALLPARLSGRSGRVDGSKASKTYTYAAPTTEVAVTWVEELRKLVSGSASVGTGSINTTLAPQSEQRGPTVSAN